MEDAHSVAAAGGDTEVSTAVNFFSYASILVFAPDDLIILC